MTQTVYNRYHRQALAGMRYDFHTGRMSRNYLNPHVYQVQNLEITAPAGIDGTNVATVTDTVTGKVFTLSFDVASGDAAANEMDKFHDQWNSNPQARQLGVASKIVAAGVTTNIRVTMNLSGRAYTFAYAPVGAGAGTWSNVTPAGGTNIEIGSWIIRADTSAAGAPANDEAAIELAPIPNAFNRLEDVVGVAARALHHEQKEVATVGYDHYPPGQDIPGDRRGGIWVPAAAVCRPGDNVEIHNTGGAFRNGWTTTGGSGLVIPWAEFLTVANAPGDLVAIGLTKD